MVFKQKHILLEVKGHHEMVGVLFKPSGLKSFVKFSSDEFTDIFVDASLVFGNRVLSMMQKVSG